MHNTCLKWNQQPWISLFGNVSCRVRSVACSKSLIVWRTVSRNPGQSSNNFPHNAWYVALVRASHRAKIVTMPCITQHFQLFTFLITKYVVIKGFTTVLVYSYRGCVFIRMMFCRIRFNCFIAYYETACLSLYTFVNIFIFRVGYKNYESVWKFYHMHFFKNKRNMNDKTLVNVVLFMCILPYPYAVHEQCIIEQ